MEFRSGEKRKKKGKERQKNERGPFALAAIAVNYIGGKKEADAGGWWAGGREGGGYVTSVFYLRG